MNKKKGQIAGQVFIYIMAIIVIGGIALVGFGAIKKILIKSCDTEKASFKTDMLGLIEKYTSHGSVNQKTIKAPCEYESVCFVDTTDIANKNTLTACSNSIIRNSVSSGSTPNIFVISNSMTIPVGYSDLISLDPTIVGKGCLCVKQKTGSFHVTFKGMGSSTELSSS